ncbi:MAG: DUF4124 domain-containing protein [Pseudomonadota bacterium]
MTALLLSTLLLSPVQAGKLYKWVDDEGRVHYSDRLPPTDAPRAHSHLDERGITIDSVDAAKTAEEIQQEAEMERLRRERQQLIDKQSAEDRVLLRTFRSEDDIIMTRNGQLQAVDTNIMVTRGNIKRLKLKLEEMQHQAATIELSGRRISMAFKGEMKNKNQALKDAYQSIISREHDKDRIRKSFAQDQKRFRELKQLEEGKDPMLEASETSIKALKNIYDCRDDRDCEGPWKRAKIHMKQHNTTPIKMDAENILLSGAPRNEEDISITLSRIQDSKSGHTLVFLDLQCKDSPQGEILCKSEKVERIKQGFQTAVGQPAD